MKTASRILGSAFFLAGFEVQDAPRYGAERRGAPIFAYVRAAKTPIHERGVIGAPDVVAVADDTLIPVPSAGVTAGVSARTVLLLMTDVPAGEWAHRLHTAGPVLTLPIPAGQQDPMERVYAGAACAGAAARLTGAVSRDALANAIRQELGHLGADAVRHNLDTALEAYDAMAAHEGVVAEGEEPDADAYQRPAWIDLPFDEARIAAPAIHAAATSVEVRTGLWRTMRPVIDHSLCKQCWWVCTSLCPDSAIALDDQGYPQIDYDHCKGCMICVAQCPPHAIGAIPERAARAEPQTTP